MRWAKKAGATYAAANWSAGTTTPKKCSPSASACRHSACCARQIVDPMRCFVDAMGSKGDQKGERPMFGKKDLEAGEAVIVENHIKHHGGGQGQGNLREWV